MRRYILKRVILAIITLIGVSIIVFVATRLSGDVALLLAPEDATEEELQEIRVQLGLDKPIPVQYYIYVKNAFKGDFGESIRYSRPAIGVILERIPATLQLGAAGFVISFFVGILFGIVSSTRRNSWLDWLGKLFAMLGQSIPGFWLGIMLILLFGVKLGWLPTSGRGGIETMIMPVFSMAFYTIAGNMRMTRSSMLEVLDSEYIKMAKIKGNPEQVVIWKHALRNALIPVVAMAGMGLAGMVGGQVIVETVFRWPGVGSLMVDAVFNRDYALVQAGVLIISAAIVTINLLVDLSFGIIDPRIKYE
jgi:ABC-type dipeptide/oligopeptide/nickel transport system permease component